MINIKSSKKFDLSESSEERQTLMNNLKELFSDDYLFNKLIDKLAVETSDLLDFSKTKILGWDKLKDSINNLPVDYKAMPEIAVGFKIPFVRKVYSGRSSEIDSITACFTIATHTIWGNSFSPIRKQLELVLTDNLAGFTVKTKIPSFTRIVNMLARILNGSISRTLKKEKELKEIDEYAYDSIYVEAVRVSSKISELETHDRLVIIDAYPAKGKGDERYLVYAVKHNLPRFQVQGISSSEKFVKINKNIVIQTLEHFGVVKSVPLSNNSEIDLSLHKNRHHVLQALDDTFPKIY